MFEYLTDRAHRVVMLAQDGARGFRHNYTGTEHLLLGLVSEDEGVAAKALETMEIKGETVYASVIEIIGEGEKPVGGHIPLIPRAKYVFELSLCGALQLGHNYIGTEHLLPDFLKEDEGVAAQVLTKQGVDSVQVRRTIIQILSDYQRGGGEGRESVGAGAGGSGDPEHSNSMTLEQSGRNLMQAAREDKLDPVIGRRVETKRVMQVFSRRTKNNPVLISEPGVGKAAVVEGLVQAIVHGDVSETIENKQIYSLDMGSLVAGSRCHGDLKERLKKVLKEICTCGDIILSIDKIHTLVDADAAERSIDAAQVLKPMLAYGKLQTIGATMSDEYRKYIEKDAAPECRFQPVKVEEPSVDETVGILKGLHDRYGAYHRATITDAVIQAAAELADRYISDRFLPDKAIDLVDEAGTRLCIRRVTAPSKLREIDGKIAEVRRNEETIIDDQDFKKTASLRDEELKLNEECKAKEEAWKGDESDEIAEVGDQEIAEVLAMSIGISVMRLTQTETTRLPKMKDELHRHVIDQDEVVKAPAQLIRRTCSGLKDPNRPGGPLTFTDPTGAGRAELAKALAEFLFGDEDALIQLDMSEFPGKHTALRLFGIPPGYVGYNEGGQLTKRVRRKPFSVVLFGKAERVHPDIFNSLLQILEEDRLTDSQNRKVDFGNTAIIMTTNLDTRDINKGVPMGFQTTNNSTHDYGCMKPKVAEELKQHFHPEFLNRVDDTIVFPPLTRPEIFRIVDLMIVKLAEHMEAQDTRLQLTDGTRELLTDMGFDPVLGARPLRHAIQREIEDASSERTLFGELQPGQIVTVGITEERKDRAFTFNREWLIRQPFEVDEVPFLEGGPSFCGEPLSSY